MGHGGDGTGEAVRGQTLQSFEGCVENFGLHSKKNWKTLDVLWRRMTCSKAMLVHTEKTFDTDKNICGWQYEDSLVAQVRKDGGLSRAVAKMVGRSRQMKEVIKWNVLTYPHSAISWPVPLNYFDLWVLSDNIKHQLLWATLWRAELFDVNVKAHCNQVLGLPINMSYSQ